MLVYTTVYPERTGGVATHISHILELLEMGIWSESMLSMHSEIP